MDDVSETPETFSHLEAYLQQLQAGQKPDRESLLREHPELGPLLDCLEVLEGFAPPATQEVIGQATLGPPSAEGEPARPPPDFGSYELIEEIGRGGMGVVYKARQHGLDRIVAVKMILAGYLASSDHVRRFYDEARAAAQLRHPHIVHIHEVGQCHGQHYFAMEYIDGKSLAERIARGPVELATAARLVERVARAVQHLHDHGIVHRDLKPSNILLDSEQRPYVTDFGLAKFLVADSKATATGVIAGTPSYMSPEQAAGERAQLGPSTDVYSLGAIFYELLTGQPPHRKETALDTLLQVLGSDPAPPRQLNRRIPRELEWICLKCLSRSPADRYPSAAALADDLDCFLKGEVLQARPPGWGQRLWSWTRREPALALRLATLAAFMGVDWANYAIGTIEAPFHWKMLTLIALWIVTAVVFQQLLKSRRWSIPTRLVWGLLDSVLLLGVLLIANGVASPLVVGYFLLIVAAGLWYRVRFVWFMAALSLISYAVLVFDFYQWRTPEFREDFRTILPDRHVIFALAMVATAAVTAYLVARLRALSSYFGQKL